MGITRIWDAGRHRQKLWRHLLLELLQELLPASSATVNRSRFHRGGGHRGLAADDHRYRAVRAHDAGFTNGIFSTRSLSPANSSARPRHDRTDATVGAADR